VEAADGAGAAGAVIRRPLGRNGPEISQVGLGTWAIGGPWAFGWGPQDDDVSVASILRAVERGVSWIDTAAVYGLGHSEEVVGRALARLPAGDRPLVFTKGGRVVDPRSATGEPTTDLRPETLRGQVEDSLRRLGLERIDLYQFHWPDLVTGAPLEDSWGTLARLADEGLIRWVGVCNFDVPLLERAESVRHVDSVQPPFSLLRRDAGADVIPWALARGSGVIVYSPMQAGILTDTFSVARVAVMDQGDWRRRSPYFAEPALGRALALRDTLRPIAARHGVPVAAVALGWVTAWPGVTGAIVGARSPDQVDGWAAALGFDLEPADLEEIAAAIEQTGAGTGPIRPA
jgi:aryl-alcohol dehydrogenase-like predicted oxidoreductase